jgi:hypothetical protein
LAGVDPRRCSLRPPGPAAIGSENYWQVDET